jgi:hypothetical protein
MEKKLSAVGNSLAVVIDKPIRKLLGIGSKTRVKIWTDGRRLVIEPIPGSHVSPPAPEGGGLSLDALTTMMTLMDGYAMTQREFAQLHHDGPKSRSVRWCACAKFGRLDKPTPQEQATMRRLEACLQSKQGGSSWEQAIAHALATVPMQ